MSRSRLEGLVVCLSLLLAALASGCVQKYGYGSNKTLLTVSSSDDQRRRYYIIEPSLVRRFGADEYSSISENDNLFTDVLEDHGRLFVTADTPRKVLLRRAALVYQCADYYIRDYIDLLKSDLNTYTIDCDRESGDGDI